MQDYQLRVIDEKSELDTKIEKLTAFTKTEAFDNLDSDNSELLVKQLDIMSEYSNVLALRINKF